ncbi:guanyl-specific ribonuclease F1 [Aspergillus lentulus]|uniref:Guanyl-specific ribonuclease F1 n=1 Tax=Aspergillus lentulus TaxID=293939 RepID=A0AAN4PPJ1_ASPLE|nr:guanyl-specific ribonuclease F1 [Aspergillus lentulus]
MLFDMKSIILYGLMALAHASPLPELSKRAKLGDFQCPDGTLSEHDIREALHECRRLNDGSIGKYPAYFGNKSNNQKVFGNIPDGTDLREFPIIAGGVYTGGEPGPYRVVTDYKDNRGDFRGVMQHTGATVGGAYTACTRVSNSKREADKDKDDKNKHDKDKGDKKGGDEKRSPKTTEQDIADATRTSQETENDLNDLTKREPKKDKDDKNKHDKGKDDKKGGNEERSVQETETEIEESTGHTVSDLTTRGKKKKIGSATCTDGVTLSQDDVANAFKECKKWDDYGRGGYPHKFGNKSGNSQVFEGVTKDLREYPIIQGGTWTGGEPGKYRVVTDYSDNFVGVMIENAGASFSRCTVNSD